MTIRFFSYRRLEAEAKFGKEPACGDDPGYQVVGMQALDAPFMLLSESPDPALTPDPEMHELAQKINDFARPKAHALLVAKRAALTAAGRPDLAQRMEVTVFLNEKGLQLGFSYALPRKELAPMPRKSFLRRILGPLYPGRRYWVMPEHAADGPGEVKTVWWPWIFWAVMALALGYLGWSLAVDSFTPWSVEASFT